MADPKLVERCLERTRPRLLEAAEGDVLQVSVGVGGRLTIEARLGGGTVWREVVSILWGKGDDDAAS